MKSIVEEASSILKAIEKGWTNAGQPKEFTVKIFEEPQKNFIGITTKNAKIGIFFNEEPAKQQIAKQKEKVAKDSQRQEKQKIHQEQTKQTRPTQSSANQAIQQPAVSKPKLQARPLIDKSNLNKANTSKADSSTVKTEIEKSKHSRNLQEKSRIQVAEKSVNEEKAAQQPIWTEDMLDTIKEWIRDTLEMLNLSKNEFKIELSHFHLRITFKSPLFEDQGREKQLFSSLSTLLLQMLKYRYSRPLKSYKIILTSESQESATNKALTVSNLDSKNEQSELLKSSLSEISTKHTVPENALTLTSNVITQNIEKNDDSHEIKSDIKEQKGD